MASIGAPGELACPSLPLASRPLLALAPSLLPAEAMNTHPKTTSIEKKHALMYEPVTRRLGGNCAPDATHQRAGHGCGSRDLEPLRRPRAGALRTQTIAARAHETNRPHLSGSRSCSPVAPTTGRHHGLEGIECAGT